MKNLLSSALAFCALILSTGCPKPAPTVPVKFTLDRPFALNLGQTGECSDVEGFTISFDKIAADSRCPMGVQCVTAGSADVVLTLTIAGASKTVTLPFTVTTGTSNVTEFQGYTLRIMGVSPTKVKDKEIKPEEYNILLTATATMPPTPAIILGKEIMLAIGAQVMVEGDPATLIRFDSVSEDSRCPVGVQCIWAGRADCVFSMINETQSQQVTLSTGDLGKGGKGEAKLNEYTLKILAIAPQKKQGTPISSKDYRVGLLLTK